jgi:hypothetical protein
MELVTCQHCGVRVVPTGDGNCPSCRKVFVPSVDSINAEKVETGYPYQSPRMVSTSASPASPESSRRVGIRWILLFTIVGAIAGAVCLPRFFLIFQYPMGHPNVAVGGLVGLLIGAVVTMFLNVLQRGTRRTASSRVLALFIGPCYLFMVAAILARPTRASFLISLVIVFSGACVIMIVLGLFGLKAYQHTGRSIRFSLSSLLLVVLPFAIYLGAIGHLLNSLPTRALGGLGWTIVLGLSAIWMVLSTAVLLWLAEAVTWLVLALLRWVSSRRHSWHDGWNDESLRK